ncbi:MAG: cytochrome c3 family protein [Thermodesulfovibrionales bacterium]|jgi:hypothetical protein
MRITRRELLKGYKGDTSLRGVPLRDNGGGETMRAPQRNTFMTEAVSIKGRKDIIYLVLSLSLIFLIPADFAYAKGNGQQEAVQQCLKCHGKRGITKKFENGESVAAYVDSESFKNSVHKSLTCFDCHPDFSGENHPDRRFRSAEQFRIKSSRACRKCHTVEQIKRESIHATLLREEDEGRAHPCTNCHGSHAIVPIGVERMTNEEQYCMECHAHEVSMECRNGERALLKMDSTALKASVHNKLGCSDCHFGFSPSHHPQRNFRSIRDFSIANAEMCRRCHFDKYTKEMENVHYVKRSQGNLSTPVCTDCHGSHAVVSFEKERTAIAWRCQKCHPQVFALYAQSVHGRGLFEEQSQDVPVCTDCHTAHDIKDPLTLEFREHIPERCSNCHANKAVMAKYGLSTDVVKTYLSSFHGVTLAFYRKQREEMSKPARQIAVCTDCHGTHNIMSTRAANPAVVRANLVKRCQQCHAQATRNFPDAWLSHYEPSLKQAPLVFMINLLYTVFLPILVVGLILQILLHAWRYAVNR